MRPVQVAVVAAFFALPPESPVPPLSFVPDDGDEVGDESPVDAAGAEDSEPEPEPPPSPDAAAGVDSAGRDEDPPERLSVL